MFNHNLISRKNSFFFFLFFELMFDFDEKFCFHMSKMCC